MHDTKGSKMIIDATKPVDRPFARRVNVSDEALKRVRLEEFIDHETFKKIPTPDESV